MPSDAQHIHPQAKYDVLIEDGYIILRAASVELVMTGRQVDRLVAELQARRAEIT